MNDELTERQRQRLLPLLPFHCRRTSSTPSSLQDAGPLSHSHYHKHAFRHVFAPRLPLEVWEEVVIEATGLRGPNRREAYHGGRCSGPGDGRALCLTFGFLATGRQCSAHSYGPDCDTEELQEATPTHIARGEPSSHLGAGFTSGVGWHQALPGLSLASASFIQASLCPQSRVVPLRL